MASPPHAPTNPEDDDAYYRAVLHDLIDRGHALARSIQERATSATPSPEDPAPEDATIAFDRVARAIRRTIALARHIATSPATPAADKRTRATAREKIIRDVENAIHVYPRRSGRTIDAEALYAELHERLDDPTLEDDLAHRPVADIIADICQDLNVAVQGKSYLFKRRTPKEITCLKQQATAPSRPRPTWGEGVRVPPPKPTPPLSPDETPSRPHTARSIPSG